MVAPVYGILLAAAWLYRRDRTATYLWIAAIIATVFNYDLVHLFTKQKNAEVWVCPFVCVIVTAVIIFQLLREITPAKPAEVTLANS